MKKFLLFITIFIVSAAAIFYFYLKNSTNTLLFDAVRQDNLSEVSDLINNGADIEARDNAGQTPLHIAAYHGFTDIANFLITKGAEIDSTDNREGTPLHWAAVNKNQDIIILLIKHGANLNKEDKFYMTPLIWAVSQGLTNNVKTLLENGADPSYKNTQDKDAFYYAKRKNSAEIIDLLNQYNQYQ